MKNERCFLDDDDFFDIQTDTEPEDETGSSNHSRAAELCQVS